jgi:tRNA-dihydrouridine synthase 4
VQIRLVREEASVPLVANGDVRSLDDVERIHERTGVSGYAQTPDECINDYVYTALQLGTKYEVFWKTLQWMLGETLNKADRIEFNSNASVAGCVDFLRSRGLSLEPSSRLLPLSPLPVK